MTSANVRIYSNPFDLGIVAKLPESELIMMTLQDQIEYIQNMYHEARADAMKPGPATEAKLKAMNYAQALHEVYQSLMRLQRIQEIASAA